MIRNIQTIKNLGIFNDYKEKNDLPQFEQFNLIYGWNGSGKSTLSEFFNALNKGALDGFPDLKYNIVADHEGGGKYSHKDRYPKNIKVFNEKYVKNNINIDLGEADAINIVLGEENKELIEKINKDKEILEKRRSKTKEKSDELARKENEKGDKFTGAGSKISAIGGGYTSRIYNRRNATLDFYKLEKKEILSTEDVDKNHNIMRQEQKDSVPSMANFASQDFSDIIEKTQEILNKTVEISMIERINKNNSRWIEEGLNLHQRSDSKSCEFCDQPLPPKLISELLGHFNDEDKKIKNDIDDLLRDIYDLTSGIKNLEVTDEARLYDDIQNKYLIAKGEIISSRKFLLGDIKKLREAVENKKQHTTEMLSLSVNIRSNEFISSIEAGNVFISECNTTTSNFGIKKDKAKEQLKNHYLSEIFDDVNAMDEVIKNVEAEIVSLKNGGSNIPGGNVTTDEIEKIIIKNKNMISNTTEACRELNEALKAFLGRDELMFESSDLKYLIKRKGKLATNLSKGEKTAIAFIYFTIHLKGEGFNIEDDIVVIDDPISSLDSNSMVYAFAFLKRAIKGSYQSFIFTHNVDFFKLVLGWLKHEGNKSKYYMIKNPYHHGNRTATLDTLDTFLEKYNNEYQYLLGLLRNLEGETVESVYHIPNAARKVLEYFLMFMAPDGRNMYDRMETIKFDDAQKIAIYKFFNKESHMSGGEIDPSFVQECKTNVKSLLDMIDKTLQGQSVKK